MFMKSVSDSIQLSKDLQLLSADQKEKIVGHINNFIMFKLYPKVFPSNQSSEDKKTYDTFYLLQNLPFEFFQVKKDFIRKEFCDFVIEGIIFYSINA